MDKTQMIISIGFGICALISFSLAIHCAIIIIKQKLDKKQDISKKEKVNG